MCNLHKIFVFLPSTRGLIVTEYTHFQKISGEEAMTSISKVSRVILRRPKDDKNTYRYRRCILHVTLQSMDFTLNDGSLKLILVVFSSKGLFLYMCAQNVNYCLH